MPRSNVAPIVRHRSELRRYQQGAVVLAFIALVAGAALLPRGDELLLIHVKNRQIEKARALLADASNHNVSSAASVVAHHELYVLEGRVDEALVEMEGYVTTHPDDVAVWKRLARMYADAQRLDERLRAAERVYALDSNADHARQLLTLYRWSGAEAAEARVLRDLVTREQATDDESVRSARLEAAFGRAATALDALERLRRRTPGAFDYPTVELYASLLLDSGGPSRLAGPLQLLPVAQHEPDTLAQLARTMIAWGRPDAAVALFATPTGMTAPPDRIALRARTAAGTSQAAFVARELVAADRDTPLAPVAVEALAALLLSISDYDSLVDVLTRHADTDPATVSTAIGHAVKHGRRDRAQVLIATLGDASLTESPLLALDLAVERGDRAAADRWIAQVDATGEATSEQHAAIAQFETRLGLTTRAFARLSSLVTSGTAPDWACADLGTLAATLGREDEALRVLRASPARGAQDAWARLAVVAGRTADVEAWLRTAAPVAQSPRGLRDLYFLLADRGHLAVAARAADRLHVLSGRDEDRVIAGRAWLAAGQPQAALVPLRTAASASRPVTDALVAYDTALVAALQAGADVRHEARRVFHARRASPAIGDEHRTMLVEGLWATGERRTLFDEIARLAAKDIDRWLVPLIESAIASGQQSRAIVVIAGALPPDASAGAPELTLAQTEVLPRRTELIRALMTLDAPDRILLPQLRLMATAVGGSWIHVYDDRLAAAGHTADRIRLWTAVGEAATVPRDERRAAVSRLVDLGATQVAAEVLRELVAAAGPADPDVQQLIYLWGPTPLPHQVNWLLDRAVRRPADERAAWMQHVIRSGRAAGARRLVAAVPSLPANAPPDTAEAWLDAHALVGDAGTARRALFAVIGRSHATLRELGYAGRLALANEWPDVAAAAFSRVLERQPADLDALRWLGALAFYDGRSDRARAMLDAYVAAGGPEPEPLYQLGELALRDRDAGLARDYFARAHAALERAGDVAALRPLRANVLVRLDARDRAPAVFESILNAEPSADHVRADYVSALLQWGDDRRAGAVLVATPSWHGLEHDRADTNSGAKRLALLKVQWLTRRGQYAAALQWLEHLGERFPSDPDVLMARAAFDGERGRDVAADRYVERAFAQASRRDDISRIVQHRQFEQRPHVAFERGSRTISNGWDEQVDRVALTGRVSAHTPFALSVEHLRVTAPRLQRANGAVGPLDADLTRVEAGLTRPLTDATDLSGALFSTRDGAGGSLALSHDDLRGRTEVSAEAGRPFWEFLESLADDGRRDRVSVQRQVRFRPDTAAWAQAAWNRYRLGSGAVAHSSALTLGVVRTIRRAAPAITLQYGLDKEHRRVASVATTADGSLFNPIPLASREVHLLGAVGRFSMADRWDVESSGGYTIDRFGGRGSVLTARLTSRPGARAGIGVWVDRRLFTMATTQQVLRVGAQVTLRVTP